MHWLRCNCGPLVSMVNRPTLGKHSWEEKCSATSSTFPTRTASCYYIVTSHTAFYRTETSELQASTVCSIVVFANVDWKNYNNKWDSSEHTKHYVRFTTKRLPPRGETAIIICWTGVKVQKSSELDTLNNSVNISFCSRPSILSSLSSTIVPDTPLRPPPTASQSLHLLPDRKTTIQGDTHVTMATVSPGGFVTGASQVLNTVTDF